MHIICWEIFQRQGSIKCKALKQGQCNWSRVSQGKRVRQEIKDVRGPGHVETSEFL